jgi:hypothetical protein
MNISDLTVLPELPLFICDYMVFNELYKETKPIELMPEFNNFIEEKITFLYNKSLSGLKLTDILKGYFNYIEFNNIKIKSRKYKQRKTWIINFFHTKQHKIYKLGKDTIITGIEFKRIYPF